MRHPASLFLLGAEPKKCPTSVVLPADFMSTSEAKPLPAPATTFSSTEEPKLWPWLLGGALVVGTVLVASGGVPLLANPGVAQKRGFTKADTDLEELRRGIKHELEHTDSRKVAERIALDHLAEDPAYYTHLDAIEQSLKKNPRHPLLAHAKNAYSDLWEKAYREALQAGMKRGEAEEYAHEVVRTEQDNDLNMLGGALGYPEDPLYPKGY